MVFVALDSAEDLEEILVLDMFCILCLCLCRVKNTELLVQSMRLTKIKPEADCIVAYSI